MNLEQRLSEIKAESDQARRGLVSHKIKLKSEKAKNIVILKARELLISFASQLQQDFKSEVESLLTMAIQSVFSDRDYKFRLDFKERKDRIEALPVVVSGLLELMPRDDMGGGALPVIGFPMRVILLGGMRPLIWLDEPLKGALGRTDELFFRAIKMFKEVGEKLKIQIIINSHETDFEELADTVHRIIHDGNVSIVRRVKPVRKVVKR